MTEYHILLLWGDFSTVPLSLPIKFLGLGVFTGFGVSGLWAGEILLNFYANKLGHTF